jgi:hypothetical protein
MPEPQNKYLTYQNIVIISDMSSRLNNRPPKDIAKIHEIVQCFKNKCVKPGEKIGDKSSISFSAFSEKIATCIDIDKIKDLGDKQSFINSTGKYKDCGLEKKLADFEDTVKYLYNRIVNPGLDLISILIEKIENENIVKQNKAITDGIDTTFINYENHIYIFTDGYLEYALSERRQNSQYYFGASEIERVRQYCVNNGVNITTALETDQSLCLPICESKVSQYLNLHILETHERDKDMRFQTYRHPRGLRDNEILEAVWQKWATESGFKSIKWKKY